MTSPTLAALSALFVWWFSTGLILWRVRAADNIGGDAHLWSVLLGLPLLFGGVFGLHQTLDDVSISGVYIAFLSALSVWAWIELAFLSGVITGPNRAPCPPDLPLVDRFVRACGTILWHEAALIAALVVMAVGSADAANAFGCWTFAVLFFARISAKLNLFFGVPRINTEFLPRPLAHLASHFRRAPMNAGFPISIVGLSLASAFWIERTWQATDGPLVGYTLLSALTVLALLEHWFMVLRLPDQKLWRWMIPAALPMPQEHGVPPK